MNKSGYGVAHRVGIKEPFSDNNVKNAMLNLHFYYPLSQQGLDANNMDNYAVSFNKLEKFISDYTCQLREMTNKDVISIILEPPEWMIYELGALIAQNNANNHKDDPSYKQCN
jgi:hypothetical protein